MTEIKLNVTIPPGYEATGEYRLPKKGEWVFTGAVALPVTFNWTNGPHIILRKLPEPERMVAVMLSESDVSHLRLHWRDWTDSVTGRVSEAARKALAQGPYDWQDDYTQAEVCGEEICSGDGKRWVEHELTFLGMSDHVADARCCLPKGHTQEHSPEPAT